MKRRDREKRILCGLKNGQAFFYIFLCCARARLEGLDLMEIEHKKTSCDNFSFISQTDCDIIKIVMKEISVKLILT